VHSCNTHGVPVAATVASTVYSTVYLGLEFIFVFKSLLWILFKPSLIFPLIKELPILEYKGGKLNSHDGRSCQDRILVNLWNFSQKV
jgi:hypothetical protein